MSSEHHDLQALYETTAGDRFNYLRRHEAGLDRHYAADLDLVLVEKHPEWQIVAFVEFKQDSEPVRFTQAVLFDVLDSVAPCFVVEAQVDLLDTEPEEHRFDVKQFKGVTDIEAHPPVVQLEPVLEDVGWGGLVDYESQFHWTEFGDRTGLIGWEEDLRSAAIDRVCAERDGSAQAPSRARDGFDGGAQ